MEKNVVRRNKTKWEFVCKVYYTPNYGCLNKIVIFTLVDGGPSKKNRELSVQL